MYFKLINNNINQKLTLKHLNNKIILAKHLQIR